MLCGRLYLNASILSEDTFYKNMTIYTHVNFDSTVGYWTDSHVKLWVPPCFTSAMLSLLILTGYAIEIHLITEPALPGVSIPSQGQGGDNTEQGTGRGGRLFLELTLCRGRKRLPQRQMREPESCGLGR